MSSLIITILNNIGAYFCKHALAVLIQSSILIFVLLALDLLLRKRVRAVFRYYIWLLVFVKLLLPPTLGLPTGIGYWCGDYLPADSTAMMVANLFSGERAGTTEIERPVVLAPAIAAPAFERGVRSCELPAAAPREANVERPAAVTSVAPVVSFMSWQAVIFLGWVLGVLVLAVLLMQRAWFVRGLIAKSEPVNGRLVDTLDECCRKIGVRKRIELRISADALSPAACGLFRPKILLPCSLAAQLLPRRLSTVLIHELAHIKRGDLWVNSVQTVLQIVYFYNPLLWLANAIVRRVREQAVDEKVLAHLGDEAKNYSRTLVDIAEMAFARPTLGLCLIGVVESKKALAGRIKHIVSRPFPKTAKVGMGGLVALVAIAAVLLPMAKAEKQYVDNASTVLDSDKDGLENRLETELGTNPKLSDTDGDSLSDYDEYCKYRTDPTKKDSDGDGKPDGDWQERREYSYTIRALCEIRPPSSLEMINDLYQDARLVSRKATLEDAIVAEVLIFPYATAHVYPQVYPKSSLPDSLRQYIEPTVAMNFSEEMKQQVREIIGDAATDVEAIEKMLQWIENETELVRELPHWEYLHVIDNKIVWHKSFGSPERDQRFLETNYIGDSMFKKKVHGTCSSTAILRGTMFRAAGLPTRLIQTQPLITRYSEDAEPLADRLRMRFMAKGYEWGPGPGGANHMYNEVFLNNRWIRIDGFIGTGPFVTDKLFVKAWSAASWNNLIEEWNERRCFRALDVSDARPKHESEYTKLDMAIEDKDLSVRRLPDGRFWISVMIHNKGNITSPRFRVYHYSGDPDKGGKRLGRGYHNVGPIQPGRHWKECGHFNLGEGDREIFVVIDPDNAVAESDETNNKASTTVGGELSERQVAGVKPQDIDLAVSEGDLTVKEVADGYRAVVVIHNNGTETSPSFKVIFYAGDPKHDARKLYPRWHNAGPIEPGDVWREATVPFTLSKEESKVFVVIDSDNAVDEADETNNKASAPVPTGAKQARGRVTYTVTIPEDNWRIAGVKCQIATGDGLSVWMNNNGAPRVTDGHGAFVRNLTVVDSAGNTVPIKDLGRARWETKRTENEPITLSYEVLLEHDKSDLPWGPDEAPYVTKDGVFWTGRALFIIADMKDITVRFNLPKGWYVSTPWRPKANQEFTFSLEDEEELTEAFVFAGTHIEAQAKVNGTEILLALGNRLRQSKGILQDAAQKSLSAYSGLFGGAARGRTLIVVNRQEKKGSFDGGVFGRSVSMLMGDQPTEKNTERWAPFVGHEVFHVWNGQTIEHTGQENWFSEGFTDYYAMVVCARLGLIGEDEYIRRLRRACERYFGKSGQRSIREARDSALQYAGGSLVAASLDIQIRKFTNNAKSLDGVMRQMYKEFGTTGKKYSLEDVIEIASDMAGKDLTEFFEKYVEGTEELPLEEYFVDMGLNLKKKIEQELPALSYVVHKMLHINSLGHTGLLVKSSQDAGYQDGDRLTSIAGTPVTGVRDLQTVAKRLKLGEKIEVALLRDGKEITMELTVGGEGRQVPLERKVAVRITKKPQLTEFQKAILSGIIGGG